MVLLLRTTTIGTSNHDIGTSDDRVKMQPLRADVVRQELTEEQKQDHHILVVVVFPWGKLHLRKWVCLHVASSA